jgi:hypothetical protein
MAEMGMRVVDGRCAVRGPAGVGDACSALQLVAIDLLLQLSDARGAAGAFQPIGVHGHTARVIAPVFQALQALHQNWDDIAVRYRCNDAAHQPSPKNDVLMLRVFYFLKCLKF